jgi:hypothetical protein
MTVHDLANIAWYAWRYGRCDRAREAVSVRNQEDVHSSSLPGGSLISALLNRQLMILADRGNASAQVGARWADIAAAHAESLVGIEVPIPRSGGHHVIERVARLDDDHRIARRASKSGLQNPDLLLFGQLNGEPTAQAVDAKFSVETARSSQVSIAMMTGLVSLGDVFDRAVGGIDPNARLVPGLFISPDSAFTRFVIRRGRGITRLTIDREEMVLIEAPAVDMYGGCEGEELYDLLFALDSHRCHPLDHFLAGLYYFRAARSVIASWIDTRRPLLAFNDVVEANMDAIGAELARRSRTASSAWNLVLSWAEDAEVVNQQRASVDRAAGLPVSGRELREWIAEEIARCDGPYPSPNQVRRRLGAWHRSQLRERFGPLAPPQEKLDATLRALGRVSRELAPSIRARTAAIVEELCAAPDIEEIAG